MKNKYRQEYRNIIAIILMVVITVPIILQPGHYLVIEHNYHHRSDKNSVGQEDQHFNCAIDDFQLAKVTLRPLLQVSQVICLDAALKYPYKQIDTKRELDIPFSLRAPPIF